MIKKIKLFLISLFNYFKIQFIKNDVDTLFFYVWMNRIVFIEPLLKRIIANKVKIKPYILIAIGDYKNIINDIPVYYIGYKMLTLLKGKTLVSNNSGIPKNLIKGFKNRIHIFHSPVSILKCYPEGAFDAFNIIFTVGPYHEKEFNLYNRLRNLSVPDLYPVGYLRIETIVNYNKYHSKTSHPTVMISVGWSRENIINTLGIDPSKCFD